MVTSELVHTIEPSTELTAIRYPVSGITRYACAVLSKGCIDNPFDHRVTGSSRSSSNGRDS